MRKHQRVLIVARDSLTRHRRSQAIAQEEQQSAPAVSWQNA